MALQGTVNFKGILLENAYVNLFTYQTEKVPPVVNIMEVQFAMYRDREAFLEATETNRMELYQLLTFNVTLEIQNNEDFSVILSRAYTELKTKYPALQNLVDA